MKIFRVNLACLMVLAVYGKPQNRQDNSDVEEKIKTGGKRWIENNQPSHSQSIFSDSFPSLNIFSSGTQNQDRAKEEKTIKDFVAFEGIQNYLKDTLKPKPIVDTASESEKNAPNSGNNIRILGDLIVKGSEALSRTINAVLEVPKEAAFKLSKGTTNALNKLGAYIVGL